ncbi:titin-like isoform X2 [Anthonomus grandis grandis]|uniref:titin-like isoform X2 n=1 Tax=Anthonomus grandis grandis TaxID=2921223 RepID=UPI002165335C|nr:titin-like isoform X2 [Anthonomus grandis grandis]
MLSACLQFHFFSAHMKVEGGVDKLGRPLFLVTVPQGSTILCIKSSIKYLFSIFSDETKAKGFTVILDARKGSWKLSRLLIKQTINSFEEGELKLLLVLRPDGFWDQQRIENCTVSQEDQKVIFVSRSRLGKFVDQSQLPVELGGGLIYNHDKWIENRQKVEEFYRDAKAAIKELEVLQHVISSKTLRPSQVKKTINSNCGLEEAAKLLVHNTTEKGKELVQAIEYENRTRKLSIDQIDKVHSPQDTLDTIEKIHELVNEIRQKQQELNICWTEIEKDLISVKGINELKKGVVKVTNWILGTAEELMNQNQKVGHDVASAEEVRKLHESIELQCLETYGSYAELLHKINTISESDNKDLKEQFRDLISQKEFMDFVCKSFALRVEKRRNILITSLRFFRLVSEYFDRTSEVFDLLVVGNNINDFDTAASQLKELQINQFYLDTIAQEINKEGEKLSDMLSMPIKDALGQEIKADYSEDIINIHDIIDATLARKNIFSDNVELQKLTLQQITLIDRYEKDAQQAITWLEDILMVMLKDHSYVGCTVHEIQTQKEEHQAFQDTAKCTYHYGCQLLNASFQLRQSCKLPIDAHSKICHNLHSYWSKIDTISQEQMTRLRVSAVFHRSVEEHCNELRDMREAVATIPILNLDTKREQLEKYIEKRENLMMEVGRMVRLGRLLRSRLKEPLYEDESFFTASASFSVNPDQPLDDFQKLCQNSVQNNEISIEAISEKLLEVTQLSEELDQALRSAQQDYLVFSTASTSSTEDTIIDGSTFLKEDSSMDRSQQSEKSDEEFLTASDTTLQHSRSSSYNTASENEHSFHSWWKQEGELKADIAKEKMVLAVGCPPEGQLPPPQEVLKSSPEVPPGKIAREVIETTHIKVQQQHNFGVKSFVLSSEIVKDVGATGETSSQPSLIKHQTDTETKIYMQSDEAGGSSQIPEDLLDKMKQCGDWINLKILEITPELTTLGNTLAEALQLQSAHNEVLRQLQTKQSPVEELLRQADQLIATQRPRAEVYAAMAESLGRAWRDINATLELRKVILDLNVQYHTKAQEFFEKNDALEAACSDPVVPVDIEAVKTLLTNLHDLRRLLLEALMVALQSGNSLLGKLKELGAEGTLDSRPERLAQSINKAISQVQGWLDELHIKRQILETMFTKSKTQLEQCLAIAILAADLKELDQIIRDRSNLLASSNQLGDSSSSAELLLHEHRKLLPEAKQLQERALKITKATEELVLSGCFAGTEASQQSYQVLSSSSDYLADLQKRESLLERVIAFFRTAQTVLAKLDQLEIQLKATDLPKSSSKLADLHAHCAKTVEDTTTVPISEGYAILDLAGHSGATEGVKKMIQELENMKIILSGLCTAHREENKRLSLALNNFYEKHDEIYNWLVTIAEAFLQGHQDTGGDLRLAEDFLQLHNELQVDLQTKGNEINQLLLTLPPILEYLEDDERRDVDSKVEGLHNRWMKLKSLIENRLQLARIYVKFHMEADIVNREMDNLEASLQGKETVDEETMKVIEEKFESIVPYFQSAKNTGLTFISELKRITEPHLDTQRARKYVESVLERLSSRQLNVTKSWQTFRDETVEKREILVRLEKTMAESTRTISWVSKLDSQLYPVLTTLSTKPSEIAAFLEHKLETVLPDIRKAQGEVGQKLKSAEELIVKAGATDEKTLTIKEKLNELSQKLAEIASEYQILLQVLCGYFKSLEEIDKKIDTFNAQLEKVRLPKDLQQVELTLRESEITKETILERFRFSQTECEHIEQRIRKQEPPQSAEHDIRKLYYVLELRKSDFEKQWRHKYDVLKTHRTFGEFIKEAQEVKNSIQEVDRQISEVKTKCTESLSVSKAVSDHFKQFTRVTESLDLRIIKLKEKGEAVEKECPLEAASIQNELYEIQAEWSETKEKLQKTQKNLDKSVKYFELIDEANDWLKEGNKLQVLIARKSTSIKQPIEATQLLEEIKSFLDSGEIKQSQRIQEILNLSNQIGMLDNSRHAPIVNGNKEMLDSFASISSELQQLSRNLISAEQERLKRLEEQKKAEREAEARRLEEQRLAQEKLLIEQKRLAEEARLAEEHRKVEEERLQQEKLFAEEQLRAAKAKLAEEARLTKERGLAEEKRLAEEARLAEEHRREQEALLAEEARKVEVAKLEVAQLKMQQMQFLEDAKRAEAERRRFEEEELKKLEAARHADEVRRLEEAKRLEEERRRLEELQMIEQERLQKEQIKLEMEKLRLEEEKIRAEQARLEEERRLAEQRRIEEENLKAQRAKLDQEKLEAQQAKIDEEQRRLKQAQLEEEAREAELSKIKAMREAEEARLEELRKAEQARLEEFRRQEEARIADEARRREEAKRLEEEKRRLEKAQMIEQERIKQEHIKLEAEKQRLEEERLRAEQARLNEEKKLAEQRRIEEEKLKAQKAKLDQERIEAEKARLEEEKRRLKQAQLDEEAREAEMARIKAMREAEEARLEELRKAEQARLEDLKRQEEARLADEVRRLEEVKRLEDEKRKLDEAQLIEQNRLKQEHIKLEAEKQRLEEERLRAERARLEEEKRLAEQRKVEEENLKAQKAKLEQEKLEAEQARLQEEKRRLKQVQLDEEARKAEMARIKAMREAEEARLEELRKAEQARIEDLRKQEDEERQRRFEDERVRLERERIESQKIIHEIHTTETHTKELFIKEKSPIVEEPHELPVFTTPLSDVVVQEGSKVSFICQVTGHPNPNITWFKSGVPIQHNPDYNTAYDNGNCSLTIEETFAEDSAKYTCKATNAAGTAETSAVLTVNETEPEEQLIAPSFVRLLQPAVAKEGATFQFECKVEGNPLPTVQWFKNKECIDNSPNYCITYNNGEAILKFDKVTLDDKADYICKASSQLGTAQSTANLIVTSLEPVEPPVFTTTLSNVMARAGQKIKLECEVAGLPSPILTWSHNGKALKETREIKLQFEGNKSSLIVQEAFPKDAGTYTVTAKNIVGEASSSSVVSVKGRLPIETSDSELASDMEPVKPSIQLPLVNTTVKEGSEICLDCIIVGQPEPEVIWYHDGRPVKESPDVQLLFQGDRCSLVIKDALPEDSGEYKVVALNSAGEASSQCILSVEAKELDAPEGSSGVAPKLVKLLSDVLASEGDEVILQGNVTGEPKPELKWLLNNVPITDADHFKTDINDNGDFTLKIQNVRAEDRGVYTVKASNPSGEAKCFAQLIVKSTKLAAEAKPYEEVKSAPVFREMFYDRTAFTDSPTKFECIVSGKPAPKVKWLFNGSPISGEGCLISTSGDRQVLSIPNVKPEHQGTITCVAENEEGKATCSASLTVQSSLDLALPEQSVQMSLLPTDTKSHVETSYSVNREVITQSSTSSSSKIITSSTSEPQTEEHKTVLQQSQIFKQVNQDAPQIQKSQRVEEYHKVGNEAPVISEKTFVIGDKDDSSQIKVIDQQQIVVKPIKMVRAPKWVSPVIGKIIDQHVDVVLEGILDGQPTPKVTWTKDGRELVEDDRVKIKFSLNKATVEIKNANVGDAGRYSCTATNGAGTAVSTADLVVRKTIFPPVFGRRLQAQVIKKNDRLIMEVEVTGTPEPTITWFKDGVLVKDALGTEAKIKSIGQSHQLILDKADLKHSGRYMVRATNAGGEAQSIADIAVYEPTPDTMVEVVKTVVFEDVKKHETLEFIATPIITSQTTQQFSEEHQKQTQLQYEQHYQADHKKAPPTPTPSKFIKGEFRESDYESDYEGRPSQIWGETSKKEFKPVKPVLTPTPVIGQQPTTNHISSTQPDRPKFQPIEKITPVLKPAICKPKPLTGAPITDVIVAKPAVPFIQPGTPPEMGYASRPRKTQQYYRSTTSGPYQNAIQTETSNIVHLDESTDTCKRTMSVQQTHKVIKFGDQYRKHEQSKLEPLPFSPEPERPRRSTSVPPPPTPSKFIPGEFRESDYESEVESAKIKPKWVPGGSDTEDLHYRKVKAPTPSREYNAHTSQRQTVVTPMEFDRGPIQTISTTTTGDYTDSTSTRQFRTFSESSAKHIMKRSNSFEPPAKVKPGTSPEYGTINNQKTTKKTATKLATHHIDSMTKDFKSKTQQFVQDVVNDVNKKQAKKPILKGIGDGDAQVYREETRNLSSGTKHVDPDTGLIYFKYDFGYEFGIILPGESKAGEIPVPKKTSIEPPKRTVDIEMPVYHESSQPDHVHSAPTPQFKPKKFTNKWDPTSESEMSEYDEPKRKFGLTAQGSRWEPSSCSPYSLSPSLPSTSPACNFPFADRAQTPPSRASTPGSSKIVIHPGQPRPPMFITPLRDIAVVSGQTAKFECIVQSEPPAEILWSKDGRIIQDSNSHQIYYRNGVCRLTISPAYPENAGSYTCTATNSVSSTNATAMLQVAGEIRSQYLK